MQVPNRDSSLANATKYRDRELGTTQSILITLAEGENHN